MTDKLFPQYTLTGKGRRFSLGSLGSLGSLRAVLLAGVAVGSMNLVPFGHPQARAAETEDCTITYCEDVGYFGDDTQDIVIGNNTELSDDNFNDAANDLGISVTVDGETLIGDETGADIQRQNDVDLERVDIQVKFDGLDVRPLLNVSTRDVRRAYTAGEPVEFLATTNYPAWIERAEIIIYENATPRSEPLEIIPVNPNGTAQWVMPEADAPELFAPNTKGDYRYVLRVYDDEGRFDETKPLTLVRTSADYPKHEVSGDEEAVSPGNGEDRTALRNIPVSGGAVTVYGRDVPEGYHVEALGEQIPIDNQGAFVVQRILPTGEHEVDIDVKNEGNQEISFKRDINIPNSDWYYVGLADLTVGHRFSSNYLQPADSDDYDKTYKRGRLAFYLKGKIKGEYLLTAAGDSGENDIDDMFSDLGKRDPRHLLRRIDPNEYYPIYGDDSELVQDAPTNGKFYVRLDKGDSHVMWGNFKSSIQGTQYMRSERALYGGQATYRSKATTSFGQRVVEATAHSAQPDTLPQRDILRGTGGSAYFLKRQDIVRGSETLTIEIRDPDTGRVLERKDLVIGEDYTIDYLQGVVLLNKPLNSTAASAGLVRDNALGDNSVRLVAQYEFVPNFSDVDGYSYGGRAQAWLADAVRIGVTGLKDKGDDHGDQDQEMWGTDIIIRGSETSYIEAEYAESKGRGIDRTYSIDGGLSIDNDYTTGRSGRNAAAWRVKGQLDLADITDRNLTGRLGGYYEQKDKGFSSLDYNIDVNQRIWGAFGDFDINQQLRLHLAYEEYQDDDGYSSKEYEVDGEYKLDDQWSVAVGVKHSERDRDNHYRDRDDDRRYRDRYDVRDRYDDRDRGGRTDLAGRLTWRADDDHEYYIFGQGTLNKDEGRDDNNRGGVGMKVRLTEKVALEAEGSYGNDGFAALAALNYDPTADEHYYLGYRLDSETGFDDRRFDDNLLDEDNLGSLVFGTRHRYNDYWSTFSENNVALYGRRDTLTSTYGVTYTPSALWTFDGGLEYGDLNDPYAPDLTRHAVSFGINYADDQNAKARLKLEYRNDDSTDNDRDAETWLLAAGISYMTNPDWRFIANVDAVLSNSDQSSFLDGDYINAAVGYAYRPVDNDHLNALFKYTYLEDLPGVDQISYYDDREGGPRQRSHVLSADFTYEVNKYFSFGGKYGFRFGKVEDERDSGNYSDSNAQLGVIRTDFYIAEKWEGLLEGRVLWSDSANTTRWGALAALYYEVDENFKVGVGYNFSDFSDDLTDQSYDNEGVFLNVVGKF